MSSATREPFQRLADGAIAALFITSPEEQWRDNPLLASRIDRKADQLALPTNPAASLERIEAAHREQ